MDNSKYPALSTIAAVYRILAWISIIFTAIVIIAGIIGAFVSGTYIGGGFFGFLGEVLGAVFGSIVVVLIYGVIGLAAAILQLAVAEAIEVFLDIEKNTRS